MVRSLVVIKLTMYIQLWLNADGSIIVATAVINSGPIQKKKGDGGRMEICWLRHKGQEVVRVFYSKS